MKIPRIFASLLIACFLSAAAYSDDPLEYSARLAPMPVDFSSLDRITGLGQLQARVNGEYLELRGEFSGLQRPATAARLHRGPLAIPGPVAADLRVSRAASGELSGKIFLTDELTQALEARELYVQIHSEAAPEGNLRGWLLPAVIK
ncbi:CHRD domain-containing protein [Proteobacteria bacterium 005FR1]|nr:CHRD domain-containing protein [Proteobacteria bacterium 005FR1]